MSHRQAGCIAAGARLRAQGALRPPDGGPSRSQPLRCLRRTLFPRRCSATTASKQGRIDRRIAVRPCGRSIPGRPHGPRPVHLGFASPDRPDRHRGHRGAARRPPVANRETCHTYTACPDDREPSNAGKTERSSGRRIARRGACFPGTWMCRRAPRRPRVCRPAVCPATCVRPRSTRWAGARGAHGPAPDNALPFPGVPRDVRRTRQRPITRTRAATRACVLPRRHSKERP